MFEHVQFFIQLLYTACVVFFSHKGDGPGETYDAPASKRKPFNRRALHGVKRGIVTCFLISHTTP